MNESFQNRTCSPSEAAEAASYLFGQFRRGEAHDPQMFAAGVAAAFTCYPIDVVRKAVDPRTGIAKTCKWLSIADVHAFCEAEMAPVYRRQERERLAIESRQRSLEYSESPEGRARAMEHWATVKASMSNKRTPADEIASAERRLGELYRDKDSPVLPLSEAALAIMRRYE